MAHLQKHKLYQNEQRANQEPQVKRKGVQFEQTVVVLIEV